ncbi:MAG: S41 family peptidase [Planctomycetota bacterium]
MRRFAWGKVASFRISADRPSARNGIHDPGRQRRASERMKSGLDQRPLEVGCPDLPGLRQLQWSWCHLGSKCRRRQFSVLGIDQPTARGGLARRCISFFSQGIPQFVRDRSLRWLGHANLIREQLEVPLRDVVGIGLRSRDGVRKTTMRMRRTGQGDSVAEVPLGSSRRLVENIGYLRVPSMDDRMIDAALRNMEAFRNAEGLIIEVRGIGGGTDGILMAPYGFFVDDKAPPYVSNIAAYRLHRAF